MVKILVVDDDALMLHLMRRQLMIIGFDSIHCINDPNVALKILELSPAGIDLIICDLKMPGVDGIEFIRVLVKIKYKGKLILVSGEDRRLLMLANKLALAHDLNIIGALIKPVTPEQLKNVISNGKVKGDALEHRKRVYKSSELKHAIEHGEIEVYYQPQVSLKTGKVTGIEALARWAHPEDGLVYPDQFIRLAEDSELIGSLTSSLIDQVLTHMEWWIEHGLEMNVSVNISMNSLVSIDYPDIIAAKAFEKNIPLSSLVLEVTESCLMHNDPKQMDIFARLKIKGFGLSIDDFGTGYSTLEKLRDIPFSEMKIDKGFVLGACEDPSLAAIVKSNVALAHELGMSVVAEGIETEADWNFAAGSGCNIAQGYFISPPIPVNDVMFWVEKWKQRMSNLLDRDCL
ncbi:EAL domain-containing response regulator [Marinobacterium jannaschii]|uniref:EAL domain-containing response regulator n=1 Tax=Marinobacterium jannaschii TaxID=64970 RepID=UPI0004897BDC|nr:EAL domain-containing response regulator [Marinobacterium jannaschii]